MFHYKPATIWGYPHLRKPPIETQRRKDSPSKQLWDRHIITKAKPESSPSQIGGFCQAETSSVQRTRPELCVVLVSKSSHLEEHGICNDVISKRRHCMKCYEHWDWEIHSNFSRRPEPTIIISTRDKTIAATSNYLK